MCGGASLGSLSALKNLSMWGVHRLESFNEEFYGVDCSKASFFPVLERFEIRDMKGLKTWCFPGVRAFASLKKLRIENCRKLIKIPFCFPCVTELDIQNCDNLIEIEMFGGPEEGSVSTTYGHSLLSIKIRNCPKLEEIPKSFVNLVDVDCVGCNKLASLPRLQHVRNLFLPDANESMLLEAVMQDSTYLEELSIRRVCSNVVVELLSMDPNRLTSLKHLKIEFAHEDYFEKICWENDDKVAKRAPPNLSHLQITGWSLQMSAKILTHFSNLSGAIITNLVLEACDDLKSFPPDVELPSTLQSLEITYWHALKTISDGFLTGCSNNLRELTIYFCRNLVCLPRSLSTFPSIQELHLNKCEALKCLPKEFHKTTSLRTLSLRECPKLMVHKECGFPTALTHLTIRYCDQMKAVSDLRLIELTSLTHLELEGFTETLRLEAGCLPTSLTHLELEGFTETLRLEAGCLPTSLTHLKLKGFTKTLRLEAGCLPVSIEELLIIDFPHLESLSELLPTLKKLRRLDVDGCPLVNQKPRSKIKKLIPQQCI